MQIKSGLLTAILLVGASQMSMAASIEIAASGSGEWNKKVAGTYVKNTKISFSDAGRYTISLQDTNVGGDFETLSAMISSPSTKYADLVLSPAISLKQQNFTIDKAGDYFLNVFAVVDPFKNPANFSLSVSAVPLPSAVIFMSSALMGLVAFMRRRAGQPRG